MQANRLAVVAALVGLAAMSQSASAQTQQPQLTVGDILSKGGKKLTKDELLRVYSGATIFGQAVREPEFTFMNKYLPDGSVSGEGWRKGVYAGKIGGRWFMNDAGQACNEVSGAAGTARTCLYFFSLANKYYAALSDTPSSPAYERVFTP